jgi:hypothetical protein
MQTKSGDRPNKPTPLIREIYVVTLVGLNFEDSASTTNLYTSPSGRVDLLPASAFNVTVLGADCTSLTINYTDSPKLPSYMATIQCLLVLPKPSEGITPSDITLTVLNRGSTTGAMEDIQPYVSAVAMKAIRATSGNRPILISAEVERTQFHPQLVAYRKPAGDKSGSFGFLYWTNLELESGKTSVFRSKVDGSNVEYVIDGMDAISDMKLMTLSVEEYTAVTSYSGGTAFSCSATSSSSCTSNSSVSSAITGSGVCNSTASTCTAGSAGTSVSASIDPVSVDTYGYVDVLFFVGSQNGGSVSWYANAAPLGSQYEKTLSYFSVYLSNTSTINSNSNSNSSTSNSKRGNTAELGNDISSGDVGAKVTVLANLSSFSPPTAITIDPDLGNG